MPTTFSGRCACEAISVIGIVEVFVAKIAPSFAIASNSCSTCRLTATFSTTASIDTSARENPLQSVVVVTRASLRDISPRVMRRRGQGAVAGAAAAFALFAIIGKLTFDHVSQGLFFIGLAHGQDVEEVGEAPVALAEDAEGLGRHLRHQAHLAALDVGPEHVGDAQVGLAGLASVIQPQEVVEVEDMVTGAGLGEDGQQAVLPLADEGHPRDEALRRQ